MTLDVVQMNVENNPLFISWGPLWKDEVEDVSM